MCVDSGFAPYTFRFFKTSFKLDPKSFLPNRPAYVSGWTYYIVLGYESVKSQLEMNVYHSWLDLCVPFRPFLSLGSIAAFYLSNHGGREPVDSSERCFGAHPIAHRKGNYSSNKIYPDDESLRIRWI